MKKKLSYYNPIVTITGWLIFLFISGSVFAADEQPPARLPLDDLRIFAEAFDRISSAFVEEIDDRVLLESAIKGMLLDLDPHSAYLDRETFSHLEESTTGNYGGLGLEVDMDDGFIKVIAPMDDTPADKAGIEAGDLIIQLDEQPVKGMSLAEAIALMRGEPGSSIKLTIAREGEFRPMEMTLTREIIAVSSVRHRILETGYGYLRIAQFQTNTGADVLSALQEMQQDEPLSGLIIDLRNNPGGVLQAAVDVSNAFIDEGLIVYTEGRLPFSDLKFNATSGDQLNGTAIVVLVNSGSASASEIVAGALQDHGRAVIMGTTTFGKGSVQTILPLNEEKAIKLTTARYYTPKGRSIQAEGITPDIWVERSTVTKIKRHPLRVTERDLPKHLLNPNQTSGSEDAKPEPPEDVTVTDYQLHEALTLLKGLNIFAKKTTN
ncbi:MAG: S41 family peptidase [Gammaproteobacteria bacterium]|nr:S41 family peptidase [Gammaproteobacteria bacterium]